MEYILDDTHPTRIHPALRFLGRQWQKKLMRTNDFDLKYSTSMCQEVKAQPKNYCCCEPFLKFLLRGEFLWKGDCLETMIFWLRSFFGLFFKMSWIKNSPIQKSCNTQNSVFSCLWTMWRNFWNSFIMRPYFLNCLPSFYLLAHWGRMF